MASIGIVTFQVGTRAYKFKKPLMLESEYAGGLLFLTHKELSLTAPGKSFGQCEQIIREELAMIWEEYALVPDSELTADAIVLKNKLLRMVEK